MTSRYSKFGAVAAALALAAMATLFLGRSTPAYALTDLAAAFDQAHVIHIKGKTYFPGHKMPDGTEMPPVETDNWIDLDNHRYRHTGTGLSDNGQGNIVINIFENVCDGPYMMMANCTNKTVTFMRISDLDRELMTYRMSQAAWGQLCGRIEELPDFVKVGQEQIDGAPHDIWQLDTAHATGGMPGQPTASPKPTVRLKLWLSADKGRLDRMQMWSRRQGDTWQLQADYPTIEYNVEVPASIFALEPPSGYTAANVKETAPLMELTGGGVGCGANGHSLQCSVVVSFTLADGSVIMGWRSEDRSAAGSQEPLFAFLVFGGPLPKLPIELFGLKPGGTSNGVTYTGYHLAWTRKANRFTEWTLYVPDAEPPASVKSLGYDMLYRFNLEPQPKARLSMTQEYGVLIGSAADFDKWVRGIIAEFSDEATLPPEVTWPRVCDLAQKARTLNKP
jgi:hypothetical protein